MESAWSYQPAFPRGEGLHTRGRHQMETGGRGCCKQPVPYSQRRGATNQLLQEEKGCIHEGVSKWKREVVDVVNNQFHAPLKKVRFPVISDYSEKKI